jgi:hypothetical protein
MSDRLVTVASYHFPLEAQMAKNLLEAQGIPAFLGSEMTAETLSGLGDEVHLQVHEKDARRATGLLAEVSASSSLDDDWEAQAESGAGVWACSLCGTPVPLGVNICPACQTPNTNITPDRRDTWRAADRTRRQPEEAASDGVQAEAPPPAPRQPAELPPPQSRAGCLALLLVPGLVPLWFWGR